MTLCLSLRMRAGDIEEVSEKIWELWSDVEGIQESPDTASGLFQIREDFEILEFGSEAAKKAARWLETDAYRGQGQMRLNIYLSELNSDSANLVDISSLNLALKDRVQTLQKATSCPLEWLNLERLVEKDYLDEYRKSVRGTALGENLWVGPPWDESDSKIGRQCYFIEPGLAFGTGDHPTTQLMMLRIEELSKQGRWDAVLDLGCGTGVLALVARRLLKPAQLAMADLDPLCDQEVKKAFALNHEPLDDGKTRCFFGHSGTAQAIAHAGVKFDLIISNIYAEVLALIAPDIVKCLKPGGLWMCSGILEGKSETILEKATEQLFHCRERRSLLKKGATLDSQAGMQVLDETWVLREYVLKV